MNWRDLFGDKAMDLLYRGEPVEYVNPVYRNEPLERMDLLERVIGSVDNEGLTKKQERQLNELLEAIQGGSQKAMGRLSQVRPSNALDAVYKALQNVDLNLNYGDFANDFVSGESYGGRAGYRFSLDGKTGINLELTGSGYKVDTPFGRFKDSGITGGDISYRSGPSSLGISYDKAAMPQSQVAPLPSETPMENLLRLIYRREF